MMKALPLKAGKYRASRNVILYVSASCNPYFVVHFRYNRDGERKDVTTKFYVRTPLEFLAVQRNVMQLHNYCMHHDIWQLKEQHTTTLENDNAL
jgi:hypothetical protein